MLWHDQKKKKSEREREREREREQSLFPYFQQGKLSLLKYFFVFALISRVDYEPIQRD